PPHRTPPSEDYVQEFMDFHRFVANRYKGKVKYYSFWNEPNGCSWINDGCGNADSYPLYTKWLIRCSQAIKEVDPDAKIIAGNLDYHSGVTHGYQYVQGIYDNGGGPHFDIVAIHPYDPAGTIYWQALTDTRNVMVSHGDAAKPIWLTEYGWSTTDYQSTANKLVQVLTELKKPEWSFVEMACYLVLNDGAGVENYGLMDANLNARVGYYAFRDMDKTWPEYVDFSADVTTGVGPLTVQFTDQSYMAGAGAWSWSFGDGGTSSERHPSHTYTATGSFTVQLTVTGTGGQLTGEKPGYISISSGYAEFSADVTAGPAPLTVQFTDESVVPGANAWLWEFGDGQTSAEQHPLHTFTAEGGHAVRLTVTRSGGGFVQEKPGYIRAGNFPKVAFLGGQLPPTTGDGQVIAHLRDMGLLVDVYDDEPENRPTAATIAAGHDLVMASSTVLSANVAGEFREQTVPFIYWESSLCWADREGMAGSNSTAGGQTQINVINNSHPIMEGIPTGMVTVTTGGADFSWIDQLAPGVTGLATPASNSARRTVAVAEPGAALLGGGVAAGKRILLFLYDTTWSQTNDTGKKIFDNAVAYSLGSPAAEFITSRTLGVAPLAVQFTDQSTGPVTAWTWDFGDGQTSTLRHPTHTYATPGTYKVTLTAGGPGGPTTETCANCIVVVQRCRADFDGDGDVDTNDSTVFEGCASGPAITHDGSEVCQQADLDHDNDVDQSDFGLFQRCLTGEDVPADPACVD
ncbi:MAG: PKD domain-containing protein, partial [Micromonosporaceae bacterium]|nr:PKD domain-containing protein [Micromonosporaceae bacterium]